MSARSARKSTAESDCRFVGEPYVLNTRTSWSGCANGSGRRSTASSTLNIAVVAPIPSASVIVAMVVKPGALRNERAP